MGRTKPRRHRPLPALGARRLDPVRPVPDEALRQILEAARWSPTAHNMQNYEIVVVDDPSRLEEIARVRSPVSEVFVRENYAQLSFSEEELAAKKTGNLAAMFHPVVAHA